MNSKLILILDFGGSQAYYTARRLRGERVYCEILSGNTPIEEIRKRSPLGLILVGGDTSELRAEPLPFDVDTVGVPVLAFGGASRMLAERIGATHLGIQLSRDKDFVQFMPCPLFEGLSENDRFFERVDGFDLPEGYSALAGTPTDLMPAFGSVSRGVYALQFYVESNDPDGLKILENFAVNICGATPDWSVENFAPKLVERLRSELGEQNVMLPVSGGVDTAVTAALLNRAIGNRLTCLFIDTGLLRKGDPEFVRKFFYEQMGISLTEVDARARFMKALRGVTDPAQKRAVMHAELSAVFAEQYVKAGNIECMAEATIYPDVIKHRPPMIDKLIAGCRRIEPLRLLFKEDVRALGHYLKLPDNMLERPSFESAGLSVRCLGEVTPEKLEMLREADAIFRDEVRKAGLNRRIAQYFVILTDLKTPGLRGDGYVCVLRALGSSNAGKASAYKLPYDLMGATVERITDEVPGINHVVYDITGRPTAAAEWE